MWYNLPAEVGLSTRRDRLVVIQVTGMHCHRCEQALRAALEPLDGVREVEVDFLSGQVSVLLEWGVTTIDQMMLAIADAGYRPTGYVQGEMPAETE
jgi:copper chaperone CopZ